MTDLLEIVAQWPLALSVVTFLSAGRLLAGRRRAAINEALHELRRPLQALTLAVGPGLPAAAGVESSVRLAAVALQRLDREVNGGDVPPPAIERIPMRPLLESVVARWQGRAVLGGGTLTLRWDAEELLVEGDGAGLSQAVDNLVVNAIEHGGPEIEIGARLERGRLLVVVSDGGRSSSPVGRRRASAAFLARLLGRRRRGHGLAVVRRTAVAHGGSFALRRSERGSLAVLELPSLGAAAA